jgi:hypothetical protein
LNLEPGTLNRVENVVSFVRFVVRGVSFIELEEQHGKN